MIPTYVIVPVKNEWHLTEAFLESIREQAVDDILILNDGSTDGTPNRIRQLQRTDPWFRSRLHQTDRTGGSIYGAWNNGFERAKKLAGGEPFNVLLSNNDIVMAPWSVHILIGHLRDADDVWISYPDYDAEWCDRYVSYSRETHGVYGDGGMSGGCFLLRGEAIRWTPLINDPAYVWWWGDAHLAECVELAGGRQVRAVGMPVQHIVEGTAQHYPELYNVKLQDRGKWISRHSRGFGVAP